MAGGSRTRRSLVALAASAWLLVAGVLGLRHEALVAHAIDPSGALVHGAHPVGHRDGGGADLHRGAGAGDDDGACALSIALHQPGVSCAASPAIASAAVHRAVVAPVAPPIAGGASLLRIAPKTSPPVA